MGVLRIMSRRGDDTVVWDSTRVAMGDEEAVAAVHEAERIFKKQRSKGATAFSVGNGQAPARLEQFDPAAEQIILLPRVVGG
ncbi:MAG: hypothetical protein ACXWP6_11165 [Ktedonobacterales bacterium]